MKAKNSVKKTPPAAALERLGDDDLRAVAGGGLRRSAGGNASGGNASGVIFLRFDFALVAVKTV
jgi:hypothetical protein